jgi:hypothetical protein
MKNIVYESTIKCPNCGFEKMLIMPEDVISSAEVVELLGHMHENNFTASKVTFIKQHYLN